MNDVATITLAVLLMVLICLLFGLMFSYYFLLKRIATSFPKYYKELGAPFLPSANRSITKTIKRDRQNYSILNALFKGLPSGFPKDAQLRQLARLVQLEIYLILAVTLLCIGCALKL